jgi:hypothetical protein
MYPGSALNSAELAVGVTRPASNAAVPHAVVCVAWPSSAAASHYTSALHQALSSGISVRDQKPWSQILRAVSVTTIGGSQNVVQWRGQTPPRGRVRDARFGRPARAPGDQAIAGQLAKSPASFRYKIFYPERSRGCSAPSVPGLTVSSWPDRQFLAWPATAPGYENEIWRIWA